MCGYSKVFAVLTIFLFHGITGYLLSSVLPLFGVVLVMQR